MADRPKFTNGGTGEDTYLYGTNHKRRGKALIFSIREFDIPQQKLDSRSFTDLDLSTLITPLENLGFEVKNYIHEDGEMIKRTLSGDFVMRKLTEVAKEDHADADCFMCVFLSYGYHGQVYTSDRVISLETLQEPFKGDKCPTLAGKPKIFILQTCMKEPQKAKADADKVETKKGTIPAEADFLFFWSHISTPITYTKDKPLKGSVFIQIFANTLRKYIKEVERGDPKVDMDDFLHFCVRVTGKVEEHLTEHYPGDLKENGKLLPVIINMLTKDLYFGPKDD